MLVISRRKGQRVTIGDEIELVITELHKSHVKVGITAPRGYTVLRGEVHDSIENANRAALESVFEGAESDEAAAASPPRELKSAEQLLARRQSAGAKERQVEDGRSATIEVVIRRRRTSEPAVEGRAGDEVTPVP